MPLQKWDLANRTLRFETIIHDLKKNIFTHYPWNAKYIKYEFATADKIMKLLLKIDNSEIQWFLFDKFCNTEIIKFYYLICYCISVKFIDDHLCSQKIFSPEDGFSQYLQRPDLKTEEMYIKHEIIVLKMIDYKIPHDIYFWPQHPLK